MREFRLDELCEILDSKRVPLSAMQRAKRQGPYPYYGAQSIIDYVDDFLLDVVFFELEREPVTLDFALPLDFEDVVFSSLANRLSAALNRLPPAYALPLRCAETSLPFSNISRV